MTVQRPPRHDDVSPCLPAPGVTCSAYRPGHLLHWIQANLLGRTPWGWRDGIVLASAGVPEGGTRLDVTYLAGGGVRVWVHDVLGGDALDGVPARVHEQYGALDLAGALRCAALSDGRGPVPVPEYPELWAAETRIAVTDHRSGSAVFPADGSDHPHR